MKIKNFIKFNNFIIYYINKQSLILSFNELRHVCKKQCIRNKTYYC